MKCAPTPFQNVGEEIIDPTIQKDIPKISNQYVPLDASWKRIPVESCIYKQNKISKSSMAYLLNNYEIESVFTCK